MSKNYICCESKFKLIELRLCKFNMYKVINKCYLLYNIYLDLKYKLLKFDIF